MTTALSIVEYPHPMLRFKCRPLKKVDKSIKVIVEEMTELMHSERGNGLAAPQVQLPFRLIVVTYDNEDFAFVNPVIDYVPKTKMVEGREGCLSLSDLFLPISRKNKIRFRAWTPGGDDVDEIIKGDLARILQHEVDHLEGALIIDKIAGKPHLQKRVEIYLELCARAYLQNPPHIDGAAIDELMETYCL